ncbi:hypothetical protein JCM9140_3339 [Halalkalibacter wakoensis JCM 9140]|uniref:DUF5667 domain-containing protein n=1 Tax=Halalkalibacter wakoensis JCM 9140 TaxID=1236970 RepID=W4Q540_9BACI|nr:DUF5667 domain-containing protein [Halalkalibacter wakoensis]GAE27211.1 hypothetical protein JCM9140_3339 [Halalkalibacter wakoensis JCM 9140]
MGKTKRMIRNLVIAGMVALVSTAPFAGNVVHADEETQEVKQVSLLPGDFFYFIKKLQENIQLVFTFDQFKEAELLASHVEKRILEAEALFANGEEERAKNILQEALEQQEKAIALYEDTREKEEPIEMVEEEPIVISDEEEAKLEEINSPNVEETSSEDSERLHNQISANVRALEAALENVQNPRAKEALAKNIAKAHERLYKKAEKELAQNEMGEEAIVSTFSMEAEEGDEAMNAQEESNSAAPSNASKQDVKAAKAVERQNEKAAKAAEKSQQKASKAAEKRNERANQASENGRQNAGKAQGQ